MWQSGEILDWGIKVVRGFQQFSPALDWPFRGLTFLGNLEQRWARFRCAGSRLTRLLRFVVGMVVLVALWAGLKLAFTGLAPAVFFRMLRYVVIGLWCAWLAPWLFVRLRLAEIE